MSNRAFLEIGDFVDRCTLRGTRATIPSLLEALRGWLGSSIHRRSVDAALAQLNSSNGFFLDWVRLLPSRLLCFG